VRKFPRFFIDSGLESSEHFSFLESLRRDARRKTFSRPGGTKLTRTSLF